MKKPAESLLLRLKNFFRNLGPGLVTGASDDDPSGIATYSQAGAQFGPRLLWTAFATYPLIVSVQEMCARIGMVTGSGLTRTIKDHYPKWLLYLIVGMSFPSIILNIGADIAGMGAVGNLLVPAVPAFVFSILFTAFLLYAVVFWSYRKISTTLKWLCISLFAYILIPFLSETDWKETLYYSFVPDFEFSAGYFMALVAILGTTISPYLFFWQSTMEVEEMRQSSIMVDKHVVEEMRDDVKGGLLLTNLVFYFIILSTGTVLFHGGTHNIDTVEDAARALQPLAGKLTYALFSLGVLGTGALAIPVLAGSLSYMLAETFGWEEGLDKKFHEAKGFYITLILSMLVGLGVHFLGISPVKALIYTAVLYGLTAPVMIALILHISNRKIIMGDFRNGFWSNFFGILSFLVMAASAIILIVLLA